MKFGPVPPKKLAKQDPQKVLLLAERWQRAAYAQSIWAEPAKEAVDFFEGRQWTETQKAEMRRQGRAPFRFNIIAPVVRLVLGYQANNKTDIKFKPGNDTLSTEQVATALSALEKAIAKQSGMEFVDGEVFLEGLISARGWYDTRLDWETNDLGEARTTSLDPFSVFPDPDASSYDLNETAAFMQVSKFVSIDEIEGALGKQVAELVRPWTMGQTPLAPVSSLMLNDEIAPIRTFGQREDTSTEYWDQFYSLMGDFVDRHRKTIRVIETQHKVREPRNVAIDLETGDKKVLPEDWGPDRVQKVLLWAEQMGNPLVVQRRMVERIQWTTIAGDLILYDAPSFYDRYTMVGYFPYFRRGVTRGMVEDLVDPQKEKNKRRVARIEVETKTANGGWMYHQEALDPVQEANLKRFGARPGFNLKWKGANKPEQIQPHQPAVGAQRLEADADEDVRRISGINESALGEIETVQSGRAIEARQRQAVISVQKYMDNLKRSKQLVGSNHLDIIQRYYSEPRIYRITGDDGKDQQVVINEMLVDPTTAAKRIVNDVTIGKYAAEIDDTPLSATFAAAQYEEMMALLEKLAPVLGGQIGLFADLIIGMSSMPRKDEWIERFQALTGTGAPPPQGGAPGGAPGGPQPPGTAAVPRQSQAPAGLIAPPVAAAPGSNVAMPAGG